jgi:ABC-type nitrate/sulfonate/bicarbonate transport system substrate-binding protein
MMTAAIMALGALMLSGPVSAQTKIRVGRTVGASGFHIPSYVAHDKGMFREEGLQAEFIAAEGGPLVRAGIAKEIDYVPIPGGGTIAMLKGAPLVYVVGQSLISQWTITTIPDIKRVEDLRGKTIGLGRPGSADYEEVPIVLGRFFKMELGRDYKVISFAGEPDRIAGLLGGSIQGAVLSFPHAARAETEGMKILVKTGDYLPRLGGTFFVHKDRVKERRDEVKRFIRAIGKAAAYIKTNKKGTMEVIQKWLSIKDVKVAEAIYKQVQNAYGPEIPHDLLRLLFESRTTPEAGWPAGKPLPDIEQFVERNLLNEVLKEMGRKPSK